MSRRLKALVAKFKRRRISRSAALQGVKNGIQDADCGSGQMSPSIEQQMTALSLSSSPTDSPATKDVMPKPLVFGSLQNLEFEFEFKLASTKDWPGPVYDEQSLFAPGVIDKARPTRPKSKHKSSKRKLSQEGGQIRLRTKERPSIKHHVRHTKKSSRPPQCYVTPPPRDPPIHLLDLPGEIRNQIYRTICVSDEPLFAQFRPIITRRKGRNSSTKVRGNGTKPSESIRRFPREPSLALGCRQLHKEMLSIFYCENKFVFRQSDEQKFSHLIMTRPGMMGKWTPRFDFAQSLTHVEVHFNIRPISSGKETVRYALRKLADGRLRVSNSTNGDEYCTCFDKVFLQGLRSEQKSGQACQNLMIEAAALVASRTDWLRNDKNMMNMMNNGLRFRPMKITCDNCGLNTVKVLESGL